MPFHSSMTSQLGATILLWHLTESESELLLQLPDAVRCEFVGANLSKNRLCERVATRLLLDFFPETRGVQIGYTSEGAPYLQNRLGNISISHTREWVTIAYHATLPIGVDIERRGERVARVASRVFNEVELNAVSDSPLRSVWLHLCWSAKEALFKVIPESEIDFREHLHIHPMELSTEGVLSATETRTDAHQEYTLDYWVCDDFVLVCATPTTTLL